MQMEALEAVHRESRRLPPIQKVSAAVLLGLEVDAQCKYSCRVNFKLKRQVQFSGSVSLQKLFKIIDLCFVFIIIIQINKKDFCY